MKIYLLLFSLLFSASLLNAQTYTLDSTVLTSREVKTGLDIPWEIIWGPDNNIWVTERYGRVSRIDPSTGLQTILLDLSATVYQQAESGLLGMALHPDFSNQPYVYLVYTYLSGGSTILERMVRYNYTGTALNNPITLIDNKIGRAHV